MPAAAAIPGGAGEVTGAADIPLAPANAVVQAAYDAARTESAERHEDDLRIAGTQCTTLGAASGSDRFFCQIG